MPIDGRDSDDFQDMPLWRRGNAQAIRVVRLLRPNVVVPMAFSNPDYLRELRSAVERYDRQVLHFCLTAPPEIVERRLRARGADPDRRSCAWQFRRARECCEAHASPAFEQHICTAELGPEEVVAEILARVRAGLLS